MIKRTDIINMLKRIDIENLESNGPTSIFFNLGGNKGARTFALSTQKDFITVTTGKYLFKRKYRINKSCNSTAAKNLMPASKPKDFNFVFNFGVGAKNQIDTVKGQFTKDMIIAPSITTVLKLSEDEMSDIYSEMNRINILGYPENFKPKNNVSWNPHSTYFIKIIADGKEKSIAWEDENVSEAKEAVQLRNLFERIQEMIVKKEEYKRLPEAEGGYD